MPGGLIRAVEGPRDYAAARRLFLEYARTLGVSLCFQNFDDELAGLPGAYVPPDGGLWLAGPADAPCGCVALRPLTATGARPRAAELKRLYVAPPGRGQGTGRALAEIAIAHARSAGYATIYLDTLSHMDAARALYGSLGFVPCPAYYDNPLGGTHYLALSL